MKQIIRHPLNSLAVLRPTVALSGLFLFFMLLGACTLVAQVGPEGSRGIDVGGCYQPGPQGPSRPKTDPQPDDSRSKTIPTGCIIDRVRHTSDVQEVAEFLPPNEPTPSGASQALHIVKVNARETFVVAGPELVPGDILLVKYQSGDWTVDTRTLPRVGLEGHLKAKDLHQKWGDRRLVLSLPFGRLLARSGDGPWFDAGGGDRIKLRAGGQLQMRINDRDDSLSDNEGDLTLELVVVRSK